MLFTLDKMTRTWATSFFFSSVSAAMACMACVAREEAEEDHQHRQHAGAIAQLRGAAAWLSPNGLSQNGLSQNGYGG